MSPATLTRQQSAMGAARPIGGAWELAALPPGAADSPLALEQARPRWLPCPGPMPVAAALRAGGLSAQESGRDLDAEDWWYRCRFSADSDPAQARLRFGGIATVADVWLNGKHLLHSGSMFLEHDVLAEGLRPGENELVIRCHSLGTLFKASRGRGRWRTRLVASPELRHFRTTLLGRMPGWCPSLAPVGPWLPILLLAGRPVRVLSKILRPSLQDDMGVLDAQIQLECQDAQAVTAAALTLGNSTHALELVRESSGATLLRGTVRVPGVERWWPHTHGGQPLYSASLELTVGGERLELPLGRIGFRSLEIDRGADGDGFGLRFNDQEIFCRGACWTPLDLATLVGTPEAYRAALLQARDAGMNLIRVSGIMCYEAEAFYDLCDELGILVWHDFMFANLDYPRIAAGFTALVEQEARQFLLRMQGRPALAVLCGNSEVEQQAAMLGLAPEHSGNPLFAELLPRQCAELAPDVPWVASSPSGGTHPFQIDRGVSHYYGVGAYLRPLEDARRAGVRFTSECLAFSHVPEPETIERMTAGGACPPTHPVWKAAVPRDPGVGWDFEDVRDFYLGRLFSVDPRAVRTEDPARYLALGRVATGEVIERTLGEWRRASSSCRGAVVWLLRDQVPGAGWGLIDSTGLPKPAWWYFRRAARAQTVTVSDEGLNGLFLHVFNDAAEPLTADLRLTVFREGSIPVGKGSLRLSVPARGEATVHADALLEGFRDLTQAYHFGPPGHDVVAAALTRVADATHLASAFYWPLGLPEDRAGDLGLTASARRDPRGYLVTLKSARVALAVAIRGYQLTPEDNYFTLAPDSPRTLLLAADRTDGPFLATVEALNGTGPVPVELEAF